jgi:putative ABC transport system permease protein
VLDGLGHGHEDLTTVQDEGKILSRDSDHVVALASVLPYLEITPENVGSVHFHGDRNMFPISAVIAVPDSDKSKALLIGRYQNDETKQVLEPRKVIRELMSLVFQVSQWFQAGMGLVAVSTGLLLSLVIALSLRLRAGEMQTMFRMGSSRWTIYRLQIAELALVFAVAGLAITFLVVVSFSFGDQVLERFIVG